MRGCPRSVNGLRPDRVEPEADVPESPPGRAPGPGFGWTRRGDRETYRAVGFRCGGAHVVAGGIGRGLRSRRLWAWRRS